MTAYYNEFDPKAAAWLRELIKRGLIADGEVDTRDLWDVRPADLGGFAQVHLCAGIGVWSYALRKVGWPDDWPVWTASFPCQPFSAAGAREGFADERHLWPAGHHLVDQCRPTNIFGEQVASKAAELWLDLVQADLEALGYAFGAVPFPSAGVGAPHIRDRAYWVADAEDQRHERGGAARHRRIGLADDGEVGGLADANGGHPGAERQQRGGEHRLRTQDAGAGSDGPAGPVNGLWRATDWLLCRDGKWRPVEPGTFPLAHGAPARVGRLRGYGNAINAEAAAAFIASYLESRRDLEVRAGTVA